MPSKGPRVLTPAQKAARKIYQRNWIDKNRIQAAAARRAHYHQNRDKYLQIERQRIYLKLYGITITDYDEMFAEQGGRCAICNTTEALKGDPTRYFCVDHCHTTGAVRGLLCVACNHLLGRYEKHRIAILRYLDERGSGRAVKKTAQTQLGLWEGHQEGLGKRRSD